MPWGLWDWYQAQLGRDEPGHIQPGLQVSTSGFVTVTLSFPRLCGVAKSLDDYDFGCLARFFESLDAGTEINLFVPQFDAEHTITKLELQDINGNFMWRVSWEDPFEDPLDQLAVCEWVVNDFFHSEDSLWFTGGALLPAKDYLALAQPRPSVQSISLLNGADVDDERELDASETGKSEAGESEADESEASESEAGESKAGESDGGESDGGESDGSDFNFPTCEVTAELRKGKRVEGTFVGRDGDTLGVWTAYLRFTPAESSSEDTCYLWRGDLVATPSSKRAVLARILGASKVGGKRKQAADQACYICLLYCTIKWSWQYATMPNVTSLYEDADATLMQTVEASLATFEPAGVAAAISQASRAATGKQSKSASKPASKPGKKRAREHV